jgi:hypothetical protein
VSLLKTQGIQAAKTRLEELLAPDQIENKYVGHFGKFFEFLEHTDSEIEICKATTLEALLALAVRQVHSVKESIQKIDCLTDQPRHLILDPEKYHTCLSSVQDDFLAHFAEKWIKLDPSLTDNQILHYIYDNGVWCTICEELLCKFQADRVYNEQQYTVYQLFCAIGALVSELHGDQCSIIAGIFQSPIFKTAEGIDIKYCQKWKLIKHDLNRLTRLRIENYESENGQRAILPGLVALDKNWITIIENLIESLTFEDALVQLESSCKGASHNSHILKRFDRSVLRLCEAVFDPRSTQIGLKDGYIYDLLNKIASILTNYQIVKRGVDQEYREEKTYTTHDCRKLATCASDLLLELGDIIFEDSVAWQFYCQPMTAIITAI